MAGTTIHSLVYKVSTSADLKGLLATNAELRTGAKLAQETQTATERYGTSIAGLNALHRKGAIDAETHRRSIDRLNKEMKEAQGAGRGGLGGMLGQGMGMLGGLGAAGLATQGARGLVEIVEAGQEAIQQEAKLAAVLEATGHSAGFTATQLTDYAEALQHSTSISDDTITGAMAKLATFKNVTGEVFTSARSWA